jgi:nucleoid-associated protein YgaU
MSYPGRPQHRLALWPWFVAAAGACVLAAGFATVQLRGKHAFQASAIPQSSSATTSAVAASAPNPPGNQSAAESSAAPADSKAAAAAPAPTPADAPVKPSFDVVRVDTAGSAVIAGRAAPGAEVTIRDGGQELGHVTADDSGQWVFLPPAPLGAGSRELTVSERTPAGSELRADASVLLVVPERREEQAAVNLTPPIAVLAPEQPAAQAAPRVLQPPPPVGIGPGARLGLDLVQYDAQGGIVFSGSAPPGAPVRLYVDNHRIGDASADPTGRWSLTPSTAILAGRHRVRVDQLNPTGRVSARVELPFARETEPDKAVAEGRVVVQPGENLWRLARHVYGSGLRYVVIYRANRDQIRNPKLIYPGQAFATPEAPQQPPSPAAAPAAPRAG